MEILKDLNIVLNPKLIPQDAAGIRTHDIKELDFLIQFFGGENPLIN